MAVEAVSEIAEIKDQEPVSRLGSRTLKLLQH